MTDYEETLMIEQAFTRLLDEVSPSFISEKYPHAGGYNMVRRVDGFHDWLTGVEPEVITGDSYWGPWGEHTPRKPTVSWGAVGVAWDRMVGEILEAYSGGFDRFGVRVMTRIAIRRFYMDNYGIYPTN